MTHWARNVTLHVLFRLAREFGVSAEAICEGIDLDLDKALAVDGLVPQGKVVDAVEWSAARSGQPTFGLMLAARFDVRIIGLPALIIERCRSIEHFYELAGRHFPMQTTGLSFPFSAGPEGGVARLLIHSDPSWPPRHFVENVLAIKVDGLRRLIGPHWQPLAVEFAHERIGPIADYRTAFGGPVEFSAGRNAVLFSPDDLRWRAHRPKRRFDQFVDRELQRALIEETGDFLGHVAQIVRALLPAEANLEKVAEELGVSPRALQRRLADEGTSFTALRTETRITLARQYLGQPGVTVSEVAARLGFSHPSVLSRLLRQELGAPPSALQTRRKQASSG
jgi:AraC-like DNA-binding protein